MRAATSTTSTVPSSSTRSCGKAIPSRSPSARTARRGDPLRLARACRRRSRPGRRGSSRRRSRLPGGRSRSESVSTCTSPSARDRDAVQLERVVEALDDRLPLRRLGERRVEVRVEVVLRGEPEDAALAARVGGLQHGREADRLAGRTCAREVARGGEARLRHAGVGERAPHRDLVRHPVRRLRCRSPAGRAARRRRRRRDGAVGGHGEHAVDARGAAPTSVTASTSVKSTASATSASCSPSASGFRSTATTRSPSSLARRIARRWWRPAPTKRTLAHSGAAGSREEERVSVPAVDLAAVRAREDDPDPPAAERAGHARRLRAAVDLGARGVPAVRARTAAPSAASRAQARAGLRTVPPGGVAAQRAHDRVGAARTA